MRRLLFLFLLVITAGSQAQQLQSPAEFLGYELGTEFTRHHKVTSYYEHLAEQAPEMVKLVPYGETYEGRPLMAVFISSTENMDQLEDIRTEHMKALEGSSASDKAIVWLSYNVHGNESVSTEASMITAYELLTGKSEWLENTVVVIDPCINPDGRDRYVNWYKQFRNHPYQTDPNSKEHHEPWLSGRPNHYMFDLNRDWVWLTQVESQQRLQLFRQWLPHIHVDFHEQGVNEPYYFAPAAEPLHEVITDWQREFQVTIGKNHARYFDEKGWFYFTKEVFDLLYPSYGDTYPTYNGGIGMTYEQGGSGRAGLGIITSYGDTLTLKDRIAHHYTTGLSTVEVSSQNAGRLNEEFNRFYREKDNYQYKSYVMQGDSDKLEALTSLLDKHEIKYGFTNSDNVRGFSFDTRTDSRLQGDDLKLVVRTDQPHGTLVKVLFEPQTKLSDSLTYDITAWSLPYAYGLNAVASERLIDVGSDISLPEADVQIDSDAYAYITDWNSMKDARFLAFLMKEGLRVRYNEEPFTLNEKEFGRGSLIITRLDNRNIDDFQVLLEEAANEFGKSIYSARTGFVDKGHDLGSESVKMIPDSRIAVLAGGSVSTLNFGEVWHFFEQQLEFPVSVLDLSYFEEVDLHKYQVIVIPEAYSLEDGVKDKLISWVKDGGKLITIGRSAGLFTDTDGLSIKTKEHEESADSIMQPAAYNSGRRDYIQNMITGAIFKARVDNTDPLAYGYDDAYYSLKLSGGAYEYLEGNNAVYIDKTEIPLSGFAGHKAQKLQKNSLIYGSERLGSGQMIYLVDNPLFRGFWENGKLIFTNALFMVGNR
ncbi:M14 family metallopeptidase [Robertkochia aurantiaca]|uniref:M14 family metallopeptidase n=1 Tax=Robertkochia aurantiaca TaxID=2873700 RepID=UPI001CCBF2D2|nr:M14 family metallopeptidase [Robertkochia sp. 3YJGBD-33]